jgi:hypothetical protein
MEETALEYPISLVTNNPLPPSQFIEAKLKKEHNGC